MKYAVVLALTALMVTSMTVKAEDSVSEWRVYIGTYTGGESEGIYLLRLDAATGELENMGVAGAVDNPSFLALHPNKKIIYSVGQGVDASGERKGMASALAIDPERGLLTLLNQESTVGAGPCHVSVDRAGRHILAANYGDGTVAVLPVAEDGRLREACDFVQHEGSSVNPRRQEGPHAHCVMLDRMGNFVFVIDLGLDKIMVYRYDEEAGKLEAHDSAFAEVAPGAGPRHIAFHPSGRFAYVVNELDNTVTLFAYDDAAGRLESLQTIGTLPEGYEQENTTAEIRVHPSGRFVYASNRGHDSIAAFAVDADTGRLASLGQTSTGGRVPRNFNVSPDGRYLLAANQQTNNVVVLRIDPDTGALENTGHETAVPSPVCVLFYEP